MKNIFVPLKSNPPLTRTLITGAYFELLSQKPDEEISVSEICTVAQVARKSFYNNFGSKSDIIGFGLEYFLENWDALNTLHMNDITDVYRAAFGFVRDSEDVMRLLYERGLFSIAEEKLTRYCFKRWPGGKAKFPVEERYADFYIHATLSSFVSLIKTWIKKDFAQSVDELVALADRLIIASPDAVKAFA